MPLSVSLVGGPPWGFRIGPPDNGNGPIVAQVIFDGRAANEGIRPNDRILAVNGKSTDELTSAELHRLIKRSTGILRLQVERIGDGADNGERDELIDGGEVYVCNKVFCLLNSSEPSLRTPEARANRRDASYSSERWTVEQKQPELQMLLNSNPMPIPTHSVSLPIDISSIIAHQAEMAPAERPTSITGGCLSPLAFASPGGAVSPSRWTPTNFTPMSSGPPRAQPLPLDYQPSTICSAPSSPLTQMRPPPVDDRSLRAPFYDGGSRGSAQQKRNFFETLALRSSQPVLNHKIGPIDTSAAEMSDESTTPTPETPYRPLVEEYDSPFKATLHQIQSMKEDDLVDFGTPSAPSDGSPDRNTTVSGYGSVAGDFAGGAESTMSDHPSLATTSLDLDANDARSRRTTEAEMLEDDVFDQTMDLSQRSDANVLELSYHPEVTQTESMSRSKNDAEASVSSSMALSGLSRGLDRTRLSTIASVTEDTSNNNRAVNGGPSFQVDMTSSYAGPTVGDINAGASRSQSIPPLLSPTSPIRGYTPINFAPPVHSDFQQFTASSRPAPPAYQPFGSATANSNNGYSDLSASSSSAVRLPPPVSSSSSASDRQAPPTFVAPPPPPTAASSTRPKWDVRTEVSSTASTPNDADGRSSIEVPDRQSVAALRSQIANKLNGAPAVKHRPDSATGSESETRSEPQTPQAPGRIAIPAAVAASKGVDDKASTVADEIAGSHNFAHLRRPGRKEAPPVIAMASPPAATDGHRPLSPPTSKEAGEPNRPPPPAHIGPSEASVWGHQRQFGVGRSPELRGSSVPVHAEASPPRGAVYVERKSSIEGNQVRTENFFDFPEKDYFNTFTSRRPVMRSQPDRRHAYREGRTALQQHERQSSPGDPDPSHSWYRMMYKKLHQLDHPEEQSVLKYRMRDYKSPGRQAPLNAAHLYNKDRKYANSEFSPSSQARINLEDRDYDRAFVPASFGLSPMRTYREKEEYNRTRVMRSKSAGRFDDGPVKATTPVESQYRVQPNRIENYVPGVSSLSRYEEEEDSTYDDDAISVKTDTEIVDRWRMERKLLSDPSRQRSQSRLDDRYEMISSRYRFDTDGLGQTKSSRNDMDPTPDDVQPRLQYRTVQSGGEVPIGGLRNSTSERNDSYGRLAIFVPKKERPRALRDMAVQASLSSLSHAPSSTNRPSDNYSALTVRTDFAPLPLRQRQPLSADSLRLKHGSPVACSSRSTGLYAFERAKASDFHVPPYRLSPERRQQTCKSHNLAVLQAANKCRICGKSWRDFAWEEVEEFFKLLDRTDQSTSTRGGVLADNSDVWLNHAMKKRLKMSDGNNQTYKKPLQISHDNEYAKICAHLEDVVKDIEAFRLGLGTSASQPTNQPMDRSSSFPEGLNGSSTEHKTTMRKSVSAHVAASRPIQCTVRNGAEEENSFMRQKYIFKKVLDQFHEMEQSTALRKRSDSLPQVRVREERAAMEKSATNSMSRSRSASDLAKMAKPVPVPPRRRYHLIPDSRASQNSLPDDQTSAGLLHFQYRLLNVSSSGLAGQSPSTETSPKRADGNLLRSMSDSSLNLVLNSAFPYAAQQSGMQPSTMSSVLAKHLTFSAHNKRLASPTLPQLAMSSYRLRSVPRLLTKASACTQNYNAGNSTKEAADRWDFGLDNLVTEAAREKELLLDEERRRKQQLEVEDQRNRRHGYIPSLSPALQSNPNRFDGLLGEYGALDAVDRVARSVSPRGTELRGVAKALYSFNAHNARELAFKKGDVIRIRRMIDQNWYEGELLGRVGIVPVNYVEVTAVAPSDKGLRVVDVEQKCEGQARALFYFDGRNANELSLRRGESVTLTKRVDSNWYEGRNSAGRVGIFPISYVEVLSEPSQQRSTFATDTDLDDVGPRSPAQRYAPARPKTPKITADYERELNVKNAAVGGEELSSLTAFSSALQQPTQTTANASKSDHGLDVQAWQLKHSAHALAGGANIVPQNAETYRALYPYEPQNADELQLIENDIVFVVEKCDDGWFIGTSLRSGQFGTFPGNYVQRH